MIKSKFILCLLLSSLSALMLSSCVYDAEDGPTPGQTDDYGICLSIITANDQPSRAATVFDEIGARNENRIDIAGGDYRILLFAGGDNNARLIAAPEFKIEIKNDLYAEYLVWTVLPKDFFTSNGIDPDSLQDYQLMVLANWESRNAYYPGLAVGRTTVADIKNRNGFMQGHNPEGWAPFENGNKGIPMYGLLKFNKRKSDLAINIGADGRFVPNAGTLYMLRAMAKIEVIDRTAEAIDNPDGALNPWVESIRISYYNRNGYAIPGNFINGQQVTSITTPEWENLGQLWHDNDGIYSLNKKDKLFYAYVTEQTRNNLWIIINVKKRNKDTYQVEDKRFRIELNKMLEQPGNQQFFFRNHIYRIYVTLDIDANIRLKYTVCPWDVKNTDIPAFD